MQDTHNVDTFQRWEKRAFSIVLYFLSIVCGIRHLLYGDAYDIPQGVACAVFGFKPDTCVMYADAIITSAMDLAYDALKRAKRRKKKKKKKKK